MTCRPSTALTNAWERSGSWTEPQATPIKDALTARSSRGANFPGQLLVHVICWGELEQLLTVNEVAVGVASAAEGTRLREEVQTRPITKRLLPRCQAWPKDAELVALVVDKTDRMLQL